MTFFESVLLYFSAITSAFLLIAGGWVKIRDWFKVKAEEKAKADTAASKAEIDRVEALVKMRLKQIQDKANSVPDATATSTSGPVVE